MTSLVPDRKKLEMADTSFLAAELWPTLLKLAKSPGPKMVAVAYYSSDAHVRCGRGDTVVVNASEAAIKSGQTSAKLLLAAAKRGARVFSHSKLHAKILVAAGQAIVGSANISAASHLLREAGVHLTDPAEVKACSRYFASLLEEAAPQTLAQLTKLAELPVLRPHGWGAPKPSLLEAIEHDLPSLNDVSFAFYESGTTLNSKIVREEAKNRKLPLPASNDWTWAESPFSQAGQRRLARECLPRPCVEWRVINREGLIGRFHPHDATASRVIDVIKVKSRLVSIHDLRPVVTPFRLRADRKTLAEILTRGIHRAPLAFRTSISEDDQSLLSTGDLRKLYQLGKRP
jgi:hypothetical protein